MTIDRKYVAAFAGYMSSVVLANLFITWFDLVPVGFDLTVPAGTAFAGAALILRDAVHRYGGWQPAVVAVLAGAGVSVWLADARVAIASGLAFLISELADAGVFAKLKKKYGIALAVAVSGVVGALIDTFVFLRGAGIPLSFDTVGGQVIVKSALSALAGVAIWRLAKRRVALA